MKVHSYVARKSTCLRKPGGFSYTRSLICRLTPSSHDAGGYTTNSYNEMNFDKKLTFENELRFPWSGGAPGYAIFSKSMALQRARSQLLTAKAAFQFKFEVIQIRLP